MAARRRGSLPGRLDSTLLDAILDFAYSPAVDVDQSLWEASASDSSVSPAAVREKQRGLFNKATRRIIATIGRIGSPAVPPGLYLELEGLHRFAPRGQVLDVAPSPGETPPLKTFERVSIETFERHFLIVDTWRELRATWECAKTEFWCAAWLSFCARDGVAVFRARVVLCRVQPIHDEPFGEYHASASAQEFQLLLHSGGCATLVGFDALHVLESAARAASRPVPPIPGLRRVGLLSFKRVDEPV